MLTGKDVCTLTEIVNQLNKVNGNLTEVSDLWLSDIQNLSTMEWKLREVITSSRIRSAKVNAEDKD